MSSTLIVSSKNIIDNNNSVFTYNFDIPIEFKDEEISLISASMYYSWRNITTDYNVLEYLWVDNVFYQIVLPVGFYEVSDINAYCQYVMRQNGHYFMKGSTYIYYFEILLNPTNYSCDIITYPVPTSMPTGYTKPTNGNYYVTGYTGSAIHPTIILTSKINEILGFETNYSTPINKSETLPNTYQSTKAPNVNPNSALTLICDQVSNKFSNLGVLYSIVPNVKIGSLFVDRPNHPVYLKIKSGTYDKLTFRLVNASTLLPIEILDPEINLLFSLKMKD